MAQPLATELVSMSREEIDHLDVIRRVLERRLTQAKAAQLLGLGPRQVGRLCAAYERNGPAGLVSQQRGKASNRRLPEALQARALDLVRERYADQPRPDMRVSRPSCLRELRWRLRRYRREPLITRT